MKTTIAKKVTFSEYDFIRLFSALTIKCKYKPIIIHHELEKNLYQFYAQEEYKCLFEDIFPKEDKIYVNNSYLDLDIAFQTALAFGFLIPIKDNGRMRSIISYRMNEIEEIISEYNSEIVDSMMTLVNNLNNLDSKMKCHQEAQGDIEHPQKESRNLVRTLNKRTSNN